MKCCYLLSSEYYWDEAWSLLFENSKSVQDSACAFEDKDWRLSSFENGGKEASEEEIVYAVKGITKKYPTLGSYSAMQRNFNFVADGTCLHATDRLLVMRTEGAKVVWGLQKIYENAEMYRVFMCAEGGEDRSLNRELRFNLRNLERIDIEHAILKDLRRHVYGSDTLTNA